MDGVMNGFSLHIEPPRTCTWQYSDTIIINRHHVDYLMFGSHSGSETPETIRCDKTIIHRYAF